MSENDKEVTTVGYVVEGVDILSMIRNVGKRNKRLQAVLLSAIEEAVGKNSPEFSKFRKLVLDETNGFTRSIVRDVFGDIEYMLR